VGTDVHVIQRGRKVSGLTSWMSADLLAFSLRGRALQRGHAEMRLELMGTTTVIEARVRILTVEFVGTSGSCNYTARIMEIERGDRMRRDGWLEERSQLTASFSRSASTSRGRRGGLGGALRSGLEKGRSAEDADSEGAADPVLVPTTTLSPDGSTLVVAWANWRSVTASWESSLREGSLEAWIERTHPPPGLRPHRAALPARRQRAGHHGAGHEQRGLEPHRQRDPQGQGQGRTARGLMPSGTPLRLELDARDLLNLAGLLTLSRLSMAAAAPAFTHDRQALAILLALAMLTDVIDGPVARATGKVSRTGAMIDGWVDKVFLVNFAWTLSVGDWVPAWVLLPWFIREIVQGLMFPFMVWRYFLAQCAWPEPSRVGKVATTALATAMFAALADLPMVLHAATALCGATGTWAVVGYWRRDRPLDHPGDLPTPGAVRMRR